MKGEFTFTILNWNIGGGKYLEVQSSDREAMKCKVNEALKSLVEMHQYPQIITLQEIVEYRAPGKLKDETVKLIDIDFINGEQKNRYRYFPCVLIDSHTYSAKSKWKQIIKKGGWDAGTYFAQGSAFLIREDLYNNHFPVCDLAAYCKSRQEEHVIEPARLNSGLYLGDRDTEPRSALVTHFIFNPEGNPKPLDIFVVNIHLTTIMKERERIPEVDLKAAEIRMDQIEKIFKDIISRYDMWKEQGFLECGEKRNFENWETDKRHQPLWILAGDFNFTPASREYETILKMNFVDVVPEKKLATKARGLGNTPALTVDYVFAGPTCISMNIAGTCKNQVLHDTKVSDHYPMCAAISLEIHDDDTASLLTLRDIKNPFDLAAKLMDESNSISKHIRSKTNINIKEIISNVTKSSDMKYCLVEYLNGVLKDSSSFENCGFDMNGWSECARHLIGKNKGKKDVHINRLILEEAYPDEIGRCPVNKLCLKDIYGNDAIDCIKMIY
jgi:endonuclease/exonuclease/phosphatase family metal-dependent hydrolase